MEEARQREANLTALAAIGPRKKKKLDDAQVRRITLHIYLLADMNISTYVIVWFYEYRLFVLIYMHISTYVTV